MLVLDVVIHVQKINVEINNRGLNEFEFFRLIT